MLANSEIKNDAMFIRAGDGFISDGLRGEGFRVEKPFYEKGLGLRILREAWFRLHLPFKELFYNKKILDFQGSHLIVYDPQVTREYLEWLIKQNRWTIHFVYGNMVGKARHLYPNEIPDQVDVWTYESADAEKYGLRLNARQYYCTSFCHPKQDTEYDVLYVGRDKNRGQFIFGLEQAMKDAGMRPKFHVVGNTRFEKHKDVRYSEELPYDEICDLISKSKAVLNVALPGQTALTVRDFEAICNNVKLITTNSAITEQACYQPENVLVLEDIDVQKIKDFLDKPMVSYGIDLDEQYSLCGWVSELIH